MNDPIDQAAYHNGSPLDGQIEEFRLPKDSPSDMCLDQLAAVRTEMGRHVESLLRRAGGLHAASAYLDGCVRKCVEAGLAEWMEQENDPCTFRGDEAVIALLDMVLGTMIGNGGRVTLTSRQVKLHAYSILFLLGRTNLTETEIGRRLGYTRANVSAVVRKYQRERELRKARGMKSDEAVESYRESATRVHAKRKHLCKTQPTNSNSFNRLSTLRPALTQTLVRES
jgi:hypothetical protein